jgi:hypothetical protein
LLGTADVPRGTHAMRFLFTKLATREDAVRVIEVCSTIFYVFAAIQVGLAFLIFAAGWNVRKYTSLPPEAILNYLATAFILASLASALRAFQSRVAATSLLLVSLGVAATTIYNQASKVTSGNLFLALVAILTSITALRATIAVQGRLSQQKSASTKSVPLNVDSPPKADFIFHPKGGIESTARTAATAAQSTRPYDREKWAALLKYDDEIASAAGRISHLGQRWIDELAHAYLTLNDKQYLRKIEEKVYADARAESARSQL